MSFPNQYQTHPNVFPVRDLTEDTSEEPRCVEVTIEAQTGGKVQIVQFKLSNDFSFNYGERYTVPAHWDQAKLNEWTERKIGEIKQKVEDFAQAEQDALLESSDWHR